MPESQKENTIMDHLVLRGCILQTLYENFKTFPYAAMEPHAIEETCRTDTATLNWNLVYLEKSGWVELGKSIDTPPYIACAIAISASGIDLVENEVEFTARFTTPA